MPIVYRRKFRLYAQRLLIAMAALTLASPLAQAQTPASSPNAIANAKPFAFDVVSIKLNKSGNPSGVLSVEPEGDGLLVTNVPMQRIISFAFNFRRQDLVFGAPEWAKSERYDIAAKVAGSDVIAYHNLSDPQRRLMLQAMLADCCRMSAHREPKDVPIYALVVAKSGSKMRESKPGDPVPVVPGLNGQPSHEWALYRYPGMLRGEQVPMKELVLALSDLHLGREVVDKTGLPGKYDFTLQFAPDQIPASTPQGQTEGAPPSESSSPSIFTALPEQLGLKLESSTGPVEALMIDHIERPTEN